jgi:hypothetical protein
MVMEWKRRIYKMRTRKIKIITDSLSRCENKKCRKWVRLDPVDETGWRTIPLLNIFNDKGKEIFVCEECWDVKEKEL